jgi:HEXXH motif-containing protein
LSGYHRLPASIFGSMSGGGDLAERDILRAGQVSKRFAQLRAILDLVEQNQPDAGRLAGVRESFTALATVQEHAPGAVADFLSGPQVGAWAAWCLRRLRGGGDTSLSAHLAYLGSITAAAAAESGVEVTVRVPAQAGVVTIPATGRAAWGGRALPECTVRADGVLLDGEPPVDWAPVRSLRTEADGVVLDARLDDLEPYWRVFGIPVRDRLTDEEVDRWQDCLARTWEILAARHPHRLATIAAAVRCLVPVEQAGRLGRVSASSADAPGAIALTEPTNPTRLAATLIHESQHYRLSALHDLRPVYDETPGDLLYSPWRNDPRPLSGVVHGVQAFLGVADFWLREPPGPVAGLEYARHAGQLRLATTVLTGAAGLTSFGRTLADSLRTRIDRLPPGVPEVRRLADDLVAEHRAGWRLRNVVPDEHELAAVLRAWQDGELPVRQGGAEPGEVTPGEPSGDNPLTRLAMAWLTDPAGVRALAEDPTTFPTRFPCARPDDVHLLAGDYPAARQVALANIEEGTATDRDWATLTVAHGRLCADPSRSPLVRHPELVRAAWERLDSGSLGTVLSRYEAGTSTSDSMRR